MCSLKGTSRDDKNAFTELFDTTLVRNTKAQHHVETDEMKESGTAFVSTQ